MSSSDGHRPGGAGTPRRDLVVALAIVAIAVAGMRLLDLGERLRTRLVDDPRADDALLALLALTVAFAAIAVSRWRWLLREVRVRALAERAAAESEARYRGLVEASPDAIVVHRDGRFVYANDAAARLLGAASPEDLLHKRVLELVHPDFREIVARRIEAEQQHSEAAPLLEERFLTLDGRVVDVEVAGIPILWRGKPAGQSIVRDVTERKEAERSLQRAEARYRALVEQVPAITYTWAAEHRPGTVAAPYLSPQIEKVLGFTAAEWQTQPELWHEQVHPEDRERVLDAWARCVEDGRPFRAEYRIRTKDDREVWILDEAALVSRRADGRPELYQGVMLDISERKRAEEQLADAEHRYRGLVEQLPVVVYVDDVDELSTATYVSPQYERLLGYTAEERLARPELWVEILHPDDRERVLEESRRTNRTGEPFRMEYRLLHRDGHVVWVRDEAELLRDADGGPLVWQGVLLDVTARKLAEQQLRETEERYRALVEHIPAILYIDRAEESMEGIYVSPQVESVLGVPADGYLHDDDLWDRSIHPDDLAVVVRSFRAGIASGEPWSVEYRWIRPDDRIVWIRDEAVVLHDEHGRPAFVQGVMFDITERKLAEEALAQSERRERQAAARLRALDDMKNTFLAAVSHELRSPLTSILGLALTLEGHDLSETDRRDLVARLATNARKLDRLLSDLLDIDRLNRGIVEPQVRATDLDVLVRRTVENLDQARERSVHVDTEPVSILADPAKVERIVENLVANAIRHTSERSTIWVRASPAEGGALIAVEDDGAGVPDELKRDIFEPFRQGPTRSPHAPGTGIGLSLVARFAELHGGRAWVEDREGVGASFRVFLPAAPADPEQRDSPAGREPDAAAGDASPVLDSADAG